LNSDFAAGLKREMLITLAKKDLYPDNPEKRDIIYNRYKQFEIPVSFV
jgi:large subunit ribosomal protein L28